jgi:hypothetical protein
MRASAQTTRRAGLSLPRGVAIALLLALGMVGTWATGASAYNVFYYSWQDSGCSGQPIDPISVYFRGEASKPPRVRKSLRAHMGLTYDSTLQQYFYTSWSTCVITQMSVANNPDDKTRTHLRGALMGTPLYGGAWETATTPHYELYHPDGCTDKNHYIAPPVPSNPNASWASVAVPGGGYVYARHEVQHAYGNGRRRAFPFVFSHQPDNHRRVECKWRVRNNGTVVQIGYGR